MSSQKSRKRKIAEISIRILVCLYVVGVIAVWLLIRLQGDRWWFASLLVYGPRWIYLAPLALLLPAALFFQVRLLVPLSLGGCIALFALMGFNVPWRSWGGADAPDLRVLSFNIERFSVTGEDFSALLTHHQPDLIAVQECAGFLWWTAWWDGHRDWHTVHHGEMLVASKYPIKQVDVSYSNLPQNRGPIKNAIYCVVATPRGDIGFCNLHLDTLRPALNAVLDGKKILDLDNADYADFRIECRRLESRDLLEWLSQFPEPKIIAGDFNMTSDSRIYRSNWNQFRDAFVWAGWGTGYTKQTVIRRRRYGLRIDHILSDQNWTPVEAWVGPDLGADHLPLFADLARTKS